ncbi:RHS repeat-associated core domain-containing protein [Marinobacter metalliresistant]|uniref:RHS domain-containing protein n=1 Tax=Marinobacter metalliresistant TaxID=2961995 RepID=A0ABZ2W393_9GAMM
MTRTIWNTLATLAVLIFTALPLSAAEVVTYYHNDHLGSPIAATDSAGAVVWQQAYDPWGLKLTVNTDERGYTGNWLDEETGLADHKARWYTSSIGRFTGIDPVKWHETNIHSFNRYAYGNNNPYSYADPDGELAFPIVPVLGVMALEALGIGLEVATMEETSDSINRSGAGTFGVTGVKAVGSAMRMGLRGANVTKGLKVSPNRAPGLKNVQDRLNFRGDPNSIVRGADVARKGGGKRAFITDENGRIIREITPQRVKERVTNPLPDGTTRETFRKIGSPSADELKILNKL